MSQELWDGMVVDAEEILATSTSPDAVDCAVVVWANDQLATLRAENKALKAEPVYRCRSCGVSTETGGRFYGCCYKCWQAGKAGDHAAEVSILREENMALKGKRDELNDALNLEIAERDKCVKAVEKLAPDVVVNGSASIYVEAMVHRIGQERDELAAALVWWDELVGESKGIYGYYLNGDLLPWGDFDLPCQVHAGVFLAARDAALTAEKDKRIAELVTALTVTSAELIAVTSLAFDSYAYGHSEFIGPEMTAKYEARAKATSEMATRVLTGMAEVARFIEAANAEELTRLTAEHLAMGARLIEVEAQQEKDAALLKPLVEALGSLGRYARHGTGCRELSPTECECGLWQTNLAIDAALAPHKPCQTCNGTRRIPGDHITAYETDTPEEIAAAFRMAEVSCPECGEKE